jgi:urease accessory protein
LAAAAGATPTDALLVYLHQAALGVISAGVRAVPVGHTHGQQVLCRLHDDIRALAGELADRDLSTAGSFCPAYEVICDAQTHLYTRLFRS